jgi:hypothetical protein
VAGKIRAIEKIGAQQRNPKDKSDIRVSPTLESLWRHFIDFKQVIHCVTL